MIRLVLLTALIGIGAFVTFGRDTAGLRASRKLLFLATTFSGCVAVLFPELVQDIADVLGVGRGTDLLLYVVTIMVLSMALTLFVNKQRSERREATLVQSIAILQAQLDELRGGQPPGTRGEGLAGASSATPAPPQQR
jgi:small membrane protein